MKQASVIELERPVYGQRVLPAILRVNEITRYVQLIVAVLDSTHIISHTFINNNK